MSITLIAVVVALVLGHAAPALTAMRQYDWYAQWVRWLGAQLGEGGAWRGRWGIALALVPPLLVVVLFQVALDAPLLGLVGLIFAVAVLFYAWGPRDLDVDVEAIVEAPDAASRREAIARLFPEGSPAIVDGRMPEGPVLVEAVFQNALRRWFGVLFWFVVAGAVGALGYRLISLCAQGEARRSLPEGQRGTARTVLAVLNWPVAQLMTFGLALAADFDRVFSAWRDWHADGVRLDIGFLGAAARVSVASELAEEDAYAIDGPARAPDLLELRDAMSLVWRVLLLWLAVLALLVLAGWAT